MSCDLHESFLKSDSFVALIAESRRTSTRNGTFARVTSMGKGMEIWWRNTTTSNMEPVVYSFGKTKGMPNRSGKAQYTRICNQLYNLLGRKKCQTGVGTECAGITGQSAL